MLTGSELVAFAASTDLARAREFYGDVLGLDVVEQSPFACVFDANGTMLRVTAVAELRPAPHTVLGWRVVDVAASIGALAARGVVFTRYDAMDQDERGVWTTPGGDKVAWFADPDGNTLSLTQFGTA
ncbi:MAG: glyoxalase [Pseudonocardiales bacterium]|nr:MAG: glyoxalase [Pseudonocardiales bacterium]